MIAVTWYEVLPPRPPALKTYHRVLVLFSAYKQAQRLKLDAGGFLLITAVRIQ